MLPRTKLYFDRRKNECFFLFFCGNKRSWVKFIKHSLCRLKFDRIKGWITHYSQSDHKKKRPVRYSEQIYCITLVTWGNNYTQNIHKRKKVFFFYNCADFFGKCIAANVFSAKKKNWERENEKKRKEKKLCKFFLLVITFFSRHLTSFLY